MGCNNLKHTLKWTAGDTEQLDLRLLDEDQLPQDLSNSSAKLGIKTNLLDSTLLIEKDLTDLTDTGEFTFIVSQDETDSLLVAGKNKVAYFYAVTVTDSNEYTSTVLEGRLFISRSVLS